MLNFKKFDSANRGVANSLTRRDGKSSTPWLAESGSRYGESESRCSNFLKFFITLKELSHEIDFKTFDKNLQNLA